MPSFFAVWRLLAFVVAIDACKDKNRYHVFINSAGRVVVEKQ